MALERTFKNYTGGKAGDGTYQKIISCIPACDVWVDAFAGGFGVTANLSLPDLTIINDIDVDVYAELQRVARGAAVIPLNLDYFRLWNLVRLLSLSRRVCVYFDPPYLLGTRSDQREYYKHDWGDGDHAIFYSFLANRSESGVNILFSHYPCDFYDRLHMNFGWRYIDFNSMTRGGVRVERLYMNFAEPLELQDIRYAGDDFTDRQRIKRKADRWIKKLKSMPAAERQYILSMLPAK